MKKLRMPLLLLVALIAGIAATSYVLAIPSTDFQEINGEVFDDWGVCRTRAYGSNGFYQMTETTFRPVIAVESLGSSTAEAYRLGEQFTSEYADQSQRAEEIFKFVRDTVRYTSDIDRFAYEEYAQNADELIDDINRDGIGEGDCEDSTVLLAVMYKGAGYRSAIVVGEGHTACLLYLPEYSKAATVFEIDGEPGWIWAEATGQNNPLGWTPSEFIGVQLAAYEVVAEDIVLIEPSKDPEVAYAESGEGSTTSVPIPFLSIIGFMLLLSLLGRRRRRA